MANDSYVPIEQTAINRLLDAKKDAASALDKAINSVEAAAMHHARISLAYEIAARGKYLKAPEEIDDQTGKIASLAKPNK